MAKENICKVLLSDIAILLSQLLIDFKQVFGGHPPKNYSALAVSSIKKEPAMVSVGVWSNSTVTV